MAELPSMRNIVLGAGLILSRHEVVRTEDGRILGLIRHRAIPDEAKAQGVSKEEAWEMNGGFLENTIIYDGLEAITNNIEMLETMRRDYEDVLRELSQGEHGPDGPSTAQH
jgi:hypothetical protein